jgi:hypothetical protein
MIAAVLAGLKIWASDRFHRAVYSEAIIAAYGEKARVSCQREAARQAPTAYGGLKLTPSGVVIGSPNVRVAFWDVDNPLWQVRYRNPHVLLTAEPLTDLSCAFDVTVGLASLEGKDVRAR